MSKSDSCSKNKRIIYLDGSRLPAIKFKSPTIKDLELSIKKFENPNFTKSLRKKLTGNMQATIEIMKKNPNTKQRCHDCNVINGGFHHNGCDEEICPRCKGQLITCRCKKKSI